MRIKEAYRNAGIRIDGAVYHLGGYNEEKLKMVWENNPHLRFAFEEEDVIQEKEFFKSIPKWEEPTTNVDGVELPKSLDINTPEEFTQAIKKTAKAQTKRKSK